ncbi:MAG: hypothetical protein IM585_16615 [Pseudanabaena sp. M135S2SP2A07QC]|nr:hypothetical protein [Pseudanabaena sp. M090S1SP2A07QC]MCA6508076.1 hypothetical protein [Pseudanabaena sp. M172S2SP2A07QC]MCA6521422.1 hypothetical protein [Pseudanabaena sp. M051S1SP2A07QC]MCA6524964.1 hypothetical protein [Pseudanabaena sp. M179S2SP2A07QC]MCA6531481.1 hypothetical protein [Pseudanabaena sp. M125S2SP2A07QC]MCA6534237.1 hypothetical protein [Pseudanabaena sp. M176S2SP2A07QC]MCA6539927.1 hypothetical protein [Pseudanabaena sp. M037S2SP2A07QC]MCA6547724.1 hypothetical prot
MRLVIREYLSMLKESRELDALLPDLLFSMDIIPLSTAQVGVRQYGVDVAAVGADPEDNYVTKLFLFTIKQGNFSRKIWDDGTPQAIRSSLNEIIDVYIPQHVDNQHKSLPKKVIVSCGGDLKQEVEDNWKGYKSTHTKVGELEFDLWDGNKLAFLIEKYLLDEYLFPESSQKYLRKTIALADQNEDEPRYFYELIEETLFKFYLPQDKKKNAERKRQKTLNFLNLSLNIVFHWCQESNNLRPSLLCAERMLLRTWDWIRKYEFFDCSKTIIGLQKIFLTYIKIGRTYIVKLQPHCLVRDGLFGYGGDKLEYPLRCFELIGVLGSLGMAYYWCAYFNQDEEMKREYFEQTNAIAKTLSALIENNSAAHRPLYDEHGIDIILGLLTLEETKHRNVAFDWLIRLSTSIIRGYRLGKHFPIASDSYEQLVALQFGQAQPKEKLMELSTILPVLADWYAILDLDNEYLSFQESIGKVLTSTNLQYWFPDETTDDYLYACNAGYESGITVSSIKLAESVEKHKITIAKLLENHKECEQLSCFIHGLPILALISSRHFRTPVIPIFWQCYILAGKLSEDINTNE